MDKGDAVGGDVDIREGFKGYPTAQVDPLVKRRGERQAIHPEGTPFQMSAEVQLVQVLPRGFKTLAVNRHGAV